MSDIYANAVDSLRIGIDHFLNEESGTDHGFLFLIKALSKTSI